MLLAPHSSQQENIVFTFFSAISKLVELGCYITSGLPSFSSGKQNPGPIRWKDTLKVCSLVLNDF